MYVMPFLEEVINIHAVQVEWPNIFVSILCTVKNRILYDVQ